MRAIKFRVWDIDDSAYCYFNLSSDKLFWLSHNIINFDEYIEQFTGLFDKNNVEIYEGDIIKLDDIISVIEWFNGGFVIGLRESDGKSIFNQDRARKFEVIGNINENPELINS